MKKILGISINGRQREDAVAENTLLIEYLRDSLGLTGTKQGCDGGECGACTVLVDGEPRLACSTLAHSIAGRRVETIESLAHEGNLSRLQRAFHENLGAQCGFCTPGMIMTAEGLLRKIRILTVWRYAMPWPATSVAAPVMSRLSTRSKPRLVPR